MSLWQYMAIVEAWNDAHKIERKPPPPSEEEFDELVARFGVIRV